MHVTSMGGNGARTLARDGVIVALVSAKGSPGTTTTAVGVAARWLRPGAVLVEADPAGGDLAARFGLDFERGVAQVALDSRQSWESLEPQRWVQRLPCGVSALLAPPGSQASASLALLADQGPQLLALLAGRHPAVVVDAGRWALRSHTDGLLGAADVVLVVARPRLDELNQLDARIDGLLSLNRNVRIVLVGEGSWPASQVADRLRVPVADVLPHDRHGAAVLSGTSVPRRGWRSTAWTRLPLVRACRGLAGQLYGALQQRTSPPALLPPPVVPSPPVLAAPQRPVHPPRAAR